MHKVITLATRGETDSNYSNIFSIWDRLFGTYTSAIDFRRLNYGLDGFDVKERQTLAGLLKMPFMTTIYNRVWIAPPLLTNPKNAGGIVLCIVAFSDPSGSKTRIRREPSLSLCLGAPYDNLEEIQYRLVLESLNAHDLSWVIHVGDIFWRPCTDK